MNLPVPEQRPQSLGQLLRYYRKRAGLTQLQLMMRLRDVGYNLGGSTIAMWELGERLPNDPSVFHFLGQVLGLSPQEEQALVEAWIADKTVRELELYHALKEDDDLT